MKENRVKKALEMRFWGLGAKHRVKRLLNGVLDSEKTSVQPLSEDEVMALLKCMSLSNPEYRPREFWDDCFERIAPYIVLSLYEKPLNFISTYGYLQDTFLEILRKGGLYDNLKFQQKLCEVDACMRPKFANLLWGYARRWSLPQTLEKEIVSDKKYAQVKSAYSSARNITERKGAIAPK